MLRDHLSAHQVNSLNRLLTKSPYIFLTGSIMGIIISLCSFIAIWTERNLVYFLFITSPWYRLALLIIGTTLTIISFTALILLNPYLDKYATVLQPGQILLVPCSQKQPETLIFIDGIFLLPKRGDEKLVNSAHIDTINYIVRDASCVNRITQLDIRCDLDGSRLSDLGIRFLYNESKARTRFTHKLAELHIIAPNRQHFHFFDYGFDVTIIDERTTDQFTILDDNPLPCLVAAKVIIKQNNASNAHISKHKWTTKNTL